MNLDSFTKTHHRSAADQIQKSRGVEVPDELQNEIQALLAAQQTERGAAR